MKKSVAASEKPVKAKEFDKELFKRSVEYNVRTLYRKNLEEADAQQIFQAVSYAIKDRIVENWMETQKAYEKEDPKMVYYMSMEFLMGRALGNNLINLKAYKPVAEALEELGLDLNLIEDQEPDAALGNDNGYRSHMQDIPAFPGFSGNAGISCIWLRYPLSLWYVQAGDPRRLSGRGSR